MCYVFWICYIFLLQLYVWDESECIPLLVKNKAAEILFGNIKAEKIYSNYSCQKSNFHPNSNVAESSGAFGKGERPSKNIYLIWLIFLKMLLEQGKNSPLKFEVMVNTSMDKENERFEMVSSSFPCSLLINRSLDWSHPMLYRNVRIHDEIMDKHLKNWRKAKLYFMYSNI